MSWGYVAVGVGTAVAGALNYEGQRQQGRSIKEAEKAQRRGVKGAQSYLTPYTQLGEAAIPYLQYLTTGQGPEGFVPPDIETSPLYKLQQQEGSEAINRQLAARGLYGSGAGIEAQRKFQTQLGADETSRIYNRYLNLVNIGQQAAGASSGVSLAGARGESALNLASGQAKADLYSGMGNIALAGLGSALTYSGSRSQQGMYNENQYAASGGYGPYKYPQTYNYMGY